jgi:hypothetical protein
VATMLKSRLRGMCGGSSGTTILPSLDPASVGLFPSPAYFGGQCGRKWVEGRYVVMVRADWLRLIHQATEIKMREGSKSERKYSL